MAAVLTTTSSAFTFSNAGLGKNAFTNTALAAEASEYTYDEFSKLTEDEVKAVFAEKGIREQDFWTAERYDKEANVDRTKISVLFQGNPYEKVKLDFVANDEVYWDDDKLKAELGLPEELFDIKQHNWATFHVNGTICTNVMIASKGESKEQNSRLMATALNYVRLNKYFVQFQYDYVAKSGDAPIYDIQNGDANCDGSVDMADVVLIMQALANPDKYGENGTDEHHLTYTGRMAADMDGNGLTVGDAQTVQKILLGFDGNGSDEVNYKFTVGWHNDGKEYVSGFWDKCVGNGYSAVITSTDELKTYLADVLQEKAIDAYLEKYNDSFFAENVLLIDSISQSSGMRVGYFIKNVDISDSKIAVTVKNALAEGMASEAVISLAIAQVSVPKSAYKSQKIEWNIDNKPQRPSSELLGLKDSKVTSVKISSYPPDKEQSFTDDKAQKIINYLSSLSLIDNFPENPDEYDGSTYNITINYENSEPITIYHFCNMFISSSDGKKYKMNYEDANRLNDILYELGVSDSESTTTDTASVRLDTNVNVKASEGKVTDEKFAAAEMKFGVDMLKESFAPTKKGEENLLISPVSVSTALAMTANGADGKTRKEMEALLGNGMTLEQINDYMAYYISKLPKNDKEKVYLADSIWFKDKASFKVYDEFLETNKKYYNAQLYKAPFTETTENEINDWVKTNTNGMIPSLLKKGDLTPTEQQEILMMLINTIYFEADWQIPYDYSMNGIFTDMNGKTHNIKRMSSEEYQYFDLGDADAFKKPYAGGQYSFVGILPREDDIVKYVDSLDGEKLIEGLKKSEDPSTFELHVTIPKFEYSYDKTLNKILSDLGMPTAFVNSSADFSKINDLTVEGATKLWISKVVHKTKIEVTEQGTRAAAVTGVSMAGGAMPTQEKKRISIALTRPFVYMIVDKNNVPLFMGVATQLESNETDE